MVTFTRILCPVDFSEASAHAIDHATAMAQWYRSSITALHVHGQHDASGPELTRLCDAVRASFSRALAAGIHVDVVIDSGKPARQILERAAALPAGLIVMGTHGAGGFERFILGSVAERVLRQASCPVLTVPPRAQATSTLPFRHLLCAVDLSEGSAATLAHACSLASESGARITALHVIEWPWEESVTATDTLPPAQAAALIEYRRYLEHGAKTRLESLLGAAPCVPAIRTLFGRPYVELLSVAAELSVDLIVMGVGRRSPLNVTVFGSTTSQVVRRATCPVLTLPQ